MSPEPSSTCEAASAMVQPRRHGPEGHRRRRRCFRFRHPPVLPARPPTASGQSRHGNEAGSGARHRGPEAAPRPVGLRRRHGNGACGAFAACRPEVRARPRLQVAAGPAVTPQPEVRPWGEDLK